MASQNPDSSGHHQDNSESLCLQCRSLDLHPSGFYLPPGAAKETNARNVKDPIELGSRSWESIKAQKDCSLCRLMAFAVESASREWQHGETPQICKLISSRMNLNDDRDVDTDLRTLDITAEYKWSESDTISLVPVQSSQFPEPFLGRLVKAETIDPAQILEWLRKCQEEHDEKCQMLETHAFVALQPYLLVIDVHEHCLTKLPRDGRYIALSYVWGGVNQSQTKLDNVKEFCTPGGLNRITGTIPKTITDAISLVSLLGERYLWVDALCIVQDDNVSKQSMIDRMHIIYQNAFLTLIAATGADANAGLPGVLSHRGAEQNIATICDGLKFIFPLHYLAINASTWASRGWTYQEYFFSKRRLIFFGGQVVFQCNTIRWREDIAQEHLANGVTYYQINIGGDRMNWEPPVVRSTSGKWDRNRYEDYLETYSDRSLSKEEDILNAFAGVIKDAAENGLETFYGLTSLYFAMDLLWLPCRWMTRRSGFPSWSWSGWKGSIIMYRYFRDHASARAWTQRASWIPFYAFHEDDQHFHLISSSYSPELEREVREDEAREEQLMKKQGEFGRQEEPEEGSERSDNPTMRREQNDHFKCWDGKTNSGKVFTPLLARLALGGTEARPEKRLQRLVERNFNRTTLLFRTMTAVLAISVLKPNGQRPLDPMREDPLLPSAPSLYLYTQDGCHVGTAWVHSEELYNKIVSSTSTGENVLDVEVAVIAGPVRADWRTREECPTVLQIMNALVDAGSNARDIIARHTTRGRYQGEISVILLDMIKEHCPETWNLLALEKLELNDQFWEALEERVRQLNFPGHTKEAFDAFIELLLNTNSHMHVDINVRYFRVLLIGNLGGEISSGTGEATEVFGKGEIREEALGLIDGLYFRDVILK